MVNAWIERLVVSAVRIGVSDGASYRAEGDLRFDSERLTEPVLAHQSQLERVQVLVVKRATKPGHEQACAAKQPASFSYRSGERLCSRGSKEGVRIRSERRSQRATQTD